MTRLLDRARRQSLAWLVFFVIVVDLIGFGIVIPILPFLSPQLGGGTDDIAFILATYSVAAAIVAPVWGRLSDRFGRRPILSFCLLGGAVSHFVLAFADVLWMVYLSRAVAGMMEGGLEGPHWNLHDDEHDDDEHAHANVDHGDGMGVLTCSSIMRVSPRSLVSKKNLSNCFDECLKSTPLRCGISRNSVHHQ